MGFSTILYFTFTNAARTVANEKLDQDAENIQSLPG